MNVQDLDFTLPTYLVTWYAHLCVATHCSNKYCFVVASYTHLYVHGYCVVRLLETATS